MAAEMETRVAALDVDARPGRIAERYGLDLSPYELLTVASLIQAEAGNPEEAPKIATVIYNRLADGDAARHRRHRPLRAPSRRAADVDFESDSPYNTRRKPGLPPTPIAAPGDVALDGRAAPGRRPLALLRARPTPASHTSSPSARRVRAGQGDLQSRRASAVADGGVAGPLTGATRSPPSSARRSATRSRRLLHNAAFAAAGLDWAYVAFEVPPGDGRRRRRRRCGPSASAGLSVTMPHKDDVDRRRSTVLTADAAALGAVNCVGLGGRRAGGRQHRRRRASSPRCAHDEGVDPAGLRCVVLGAGGAARAVVRALGDAGAAEVVVVNRTAERAEAAAALAGPVGRVGTDADVADADLVVNATSVGMGAAPDADRPAARSPAACCGRARWWSTSSTSPLGTPLLAPPPPPGARPVDGLGMLVHQAALAFAPLDRRRAASTCARHGGRRPAG